MLNKNYIHRKPARIKWWTWSESRETGNKVKDTLIQKGLMSTNHEDPHSEHLYKYKESLEIKGGNAYVYLHLPTNTEVVFMI